MNDWPMTKSEAERYAEGWKATAEKSADLAKRIEANGNYRSWMETAAKLPR